MEAGIDRIDEQLVKLEAAAALATGDTKRLIEEQIELLRGGHQEISAGAIINTPENDPPENAELQHEVEEAVAELRTNIP